MDESKESSGTPAWVWIAIGCSIPLLLVAALLGGALFFGYRMARQVTDSSPESRASRVQEMLGCEKIPEGYHPVLTLSVPFLADVAILSDQPVLSGKGLPESKKAFRERGFIYVKSIRGKDEKKLTDYVEGRATLDELLGGNANIQMGQLEPIDRGEFEAAGGKVHWSSNRGDLRAHGQAVDGLVTLAVVECPSDRKFRLGVWFGPDKGPDALAGTEADPARIRDFMSQFSLCK